MFDNLPGASIVLRDGDTCQQKKDTIPALTEYIEPSVGQILKR